MAVSSIFPEQGHSERAAPTVELLTGDRAGSTDPRPIDGVATPADRPAVMTGYGTGSMC